MFFFSFLGWCELVQPPIRSSKKKNRKKKCSGGSERRERRGTVRVRCVYGVRGTDLRSGEAPYRRGLIEDKLMTVTTTGGGGAGVDGRAREEGRRGGGRDYGCRSLRDHSCCCFLGGLLWVL